MSAKEPPKKPQAKSPKPDRPPIKPSWVSILGKPWFLFLAAPVLALLLAGGFYGGRHMLLNHVTDAAGQAVVIQVPRGHGLGQVAGLLQEKGVIDSARLFALAARLKGMGRQLKAGEYSLSPAMSYGLILQRLRSGRVVRYSLVIPEGFSAAQIADRVNAAGLGSGPALLALARGGELAPELGVKGGSLEGYLFPATYRLPKGLSEKALLKIMVQRFGQTWQPLAQAAKAKKMTRHQAVTLASIIEREARLDSERPLISAVYHNRLKRRMPLQADPTVIYGISEFNGNLTKRDLKTDGPYNTYTRPGLPPGPICSPGQASLTAAVIPANVPYLYFVAKGDGSHHFSKTYRGHVNAVNRYQKRRRR